MYIKNSIKFLLHKRTPNQSIGLGVRMRLTLKGQKPLDFPLGHKVDVDNWDFENERAINGPEINRTIDEYKSIMNDVLARYSILEKRVPTPSEVKDLFNDMIGKKPIYTEEVISIEEKFNEYIELIGKQNNWSESSYKKNSTIRKHFLSSIKGKSFNEIDNDTLQSFLDYLLKKGLRNTTIQKDYQFVRWFLRWSRNNGYYNGNADQVFKPRLKGVDGNQKEIIYLSLNELKQLQSCEIPEQKNYLTHTRDVFLFCCYTSLRYSDVKALKKDDIIGGVIKIVTQKTNDGLIIELNDKAKSILDKYNNCILPNNAALPVISNQKYNEYLKELCHLAQLNTRTRIVYYKGNQRYDEYYPKWQLITSHCARRTFVVTALQLGIPVEVIIRWTGHSDYEAMKPYVAIVDELKKSEMNKFNSL